MPPIHLLIKPVSGRCNMACRYCFYRDEEQNRSASFRETMSRETVEAVVRRAFEAAEGECVFAFQGGEPTLAGLPFFRAFAETVRRENKKGLSVRYAIQTNGLLLNKEWVRFFKENRFLVGLSLDGDKDLHDSLRPGADGKGTFAGAMRAARLLQSGGVDLNVLTVVTGPLAARIDRVYAFYARNGFAFQQYIPCLDPIGEERGKREYSLTPERYGQFLCRLFDLWYRDRKRGRPVSVRMFDNLLLILRDTPPESCGMLGVCTVQNVVEADGTVYPCDFYAVDRYRLGNLNEEGFGEIHRKRLESGFLQDSFARAPECAGCFWRNVCRGGCRRDRDRFDGTLGLNWYCEAYKTFFHHAIDRLQELAYSLSRNGG